MVIMDNYVLHLMRFVILIILYIFIVIYLYLMDIEI
jgi:hypothetical protein